MKKIVIVGNGVAGIEAAKVARENDSEAQITIISKENDLFYFRPRLIEYISDKVPFEDIIVYQKKWYEDRNITLMLGEEVVEIDKDRKTLTLKNGGAIEYTKLLLANGSNPFMPPVEGNNKKGVFTIKDRTDVDAIKNYYKDKKKAIVIGGGLLGIETAHSLQEVGLDVTIVEFADRLLPRQLDNEGGEFLQGMLKKMGLKILLNESAKQILGDEKVEGIELNSGKKLDAELIIFSVGIRPRQDLPAKLGLNFNKGIVVNSYMQSSEPDVYAAGDVAEANGMVYGLWIPSKEQGAIAGKNMVQDNVEVYQGSKLEARLKVAGISLFSAGIIQGDTLTETTEKTDSTYKKVFSKEGEVVGAIVIGDQKQAMQLSKVIK